MKYPFPTVSCEVEGEAKALSCARELISYSAWFELTPLPDDRFRFTVKPENKGIFD